MGATDGAHLILNPYVAKMKKMLPGKPTSLERLMAKALTDMEIPFEREVTIGHYRVDFLLRDKKTVIEADGDYWHNNPLRKSKDERRDKYLNACGLRVYRAAEWAIKQDAKACVRAALKGIK